jgi:hypothetical protein
MLRTALAILGSLLTTSAPAAPVPTHLMPNTPPYYPTVVGTKWVYDYNGQELIEAISAVEHKDGVTTITLEQWIGERHVPASAVLQLSKHGLSRTSVNRAEYTEPYWLLKAPIRPGDKWNLNVAFKQSERTPQTGTKVIGETETIEVMGKKFKAIHVITDLSGASETMHSWYVPGIGLVKQSGSTKMLLKSFTPGPK